MADDPLNLGPIAENAKPEPEAPRRRTRRLAIDAEAVVQHVLEVVQQAQDERADWMGKRLIRYAKLRGWTATDEAREQLYWEGCANQHISVMMANSLRVKAGLQNAVMGIRPIMSPKVLRKDLKERAERANNLIDYQLFVENEGEQAVEKYIGLFVDDGTVFSFQPLARDRRTTYDVRVLPRPEVPMIEAMIETLPRLFPAVTDLAAKDADGYSWTAQHRGQDDEPPSEVTFRVYDRDETRIEIVSEWEISQFDGPTMLVDALEDVVVPMRCENPQPISPQNPQGAPWVARLVRVDLDTIRRGMDDGTYDLLTKEDFDEIAGQAGPRRPTDPSAEDQLKEERDRQAGLSPMAVSERKPQGEEDEKALPAGWVTMIQWYGGWDVNGDHRNEEVIFWTIKEAKKLARAKHLSELYPGTPVHRPISYACFIPVEGQIYGIGLVELMEGLHDLIHVEINQALDNGDLANRPFGFYRASSGIKAETIKLWPGDLYPVDNPVGDVAFPQMPNRDQSFHLNMVGMAIQFLDRLTQIGPLQQGQVPQGKASALRTLGTTLAILQQGAALPEQILRRLFQGLRQVWSQFHLLNTRFLPKRKAYLIAGKPLDQDEAYGMIQSPDEIAVPVSFDFQATLLNTNKGLVQQSLMSLGQALFNPLGFQTGVVTAEQFYNWAKDLVQAGQLDPTRYLKKPVGVPEGPRMTAEEAIVTLLDGRLPEYAPFEDPQEHYAKLMKYAQSDEFGFMVGGKELLFREYMQMALNGVRQAMQQQQMLQAAQAFSTAIGQQGGGGGQSSGGEAPPMQTNQPIMEEISGASGGPMG